MTGLLGPDGRPIASTFKKAPPPKLGPAFGQWGGPQAQMAMGLPGGGVVQFDLSKLTLADYRAMRDHYQVNASLALLSFMLHQSDWHVVSKDKKIADHCEENLRKLWTPLNRALSTSHWSGYSPNALEWENDLSGKGSTQLTKIKDLYPEECEVNWKQVNGWAPPGHTPPKFKIFDGIKQLPFVRSGSPSYPIPVDNSLWFPLLMENGDYTGRKLLRPAFTPWFFSILVHLFANRYYERYGEPTPIGRAPFEDSITVGDATVRGNDFLLQVLQQLRNRSVVVLPNDQTDMGNGKMTYDYAIEYLESQMRGADFERYLTRLDEEVSIGIFTPILLMRTADVGSYNLGVGHMQTWLWMLNALNDDRKLYIDKFILRRMVNFNFSLTAPDAEIVFRKMGNSDAEMVRAVLTELIRGGKAKPDLIQLGQMAGMNLTEIKETLQPQQDPNNPDQPQIDPRTGRENPAPDKGTGPKGVGKARATAKNISARVAPTISNAYSRGTINPSLKVTMGYKRHMQAAFEEAGYGDAVQRVDALYSQMDGVVGTALEYADEFSGPESFMAFFEGQFAQRLEDALNG